MAIYYTLYATNKKPKESNWNEEIPYATFMFLGHAIRAARSISEDAYNLMDEETHVIVREDEKGKIVYEAQEGKAYNG